MSSPPNPLDIYRTYAYHHILVACDSSATANSLADVSQISLFDHPRDKFCPRLASNGGKYVVLINGLSDAEFSINSAKWSSVIVPKVPGRGQADASTTMAVDGELEIVEPKGANFFNLLNRVTKTLRIDPTSMVYLLKTVFVGTTHDGMSDTLTTIRPLQFVLTDITAAFDTTGSTYSISLVGMVNGAGKLPQVNAIVQGYTTTLHKNMTLYKALKFIEKGINGLYEEQKASAIRAATECRSTAKGSFEKIDFEKEFMNVRYVIEPAEIYDDKAYQAGDVYYSNRSNSGSNDAHISDFGEAGTIERIINEVMRSSKQVLADEKAPATESVDSSKRKIYKIASSVQIGQDDKGNPEYIVTFYVHQYVGTIIPADQVDTWSPNLPGTPEDDPDSVGITFDYTFTGQNIDILDLDIQMNYGLTFFQMLGAHQSSPSSKMDTSTYTNSSTYVSGTGNKDGPGDQKPPSSYCDLDAGGDDVVKKPLFLGTMVTHPSFRDTRRPGATASYNSLLHRIAALENMGIKMKIRGNPQLLEDTTQQADDISFRETEPTLAPNSTRSLTPKIHQVPGYIKVNIWMPNDWRWDTGDADQQVSTAAGDYASNFWYKGWYMLLSIDHEFSDGEFTQNLEIYSLPTDAGQSEIGTCIDEKVYSENQDDKHPTVNPAGNQSSDTSGTTSSENTQTNTATAENRTIADMAKSMNGSGSQ